MTERSDLSLKIVALWGESKTCAEIAELIGDGVTRALVNRRLWGFKLPIHTSATRAGVGRRIEVALNPCQAPGCSKLIKRAPGVTPWNYVRIKYCSPACRKKCQSGISAEWAKIFAEQRRAAAEIAPEPKAAGLSAEEQIAEFLRTRGATKCPPGFAAPTQAALDGDAASKAIGEIIIDTPQRPFFFGSHRTAAANAVNS